ncbi:uncharacterized protein LOC142563562 [Dermacentor variabilis]|uniref:uncharacterized protein LOC142563562 n=1 Tax=Dermacentor variabilis TaxID=34621 RepID=UPI003F5AEFA5
MRHPGFSVEKSSTTAKSGPENETEFCGSEVHHDNNLLSPDGRDLESFSPEAPAPPERANNTKMFIDYDYLDSPQKDPGNTLGRKPLTSLYSDQSMVQSDRKDHMDVCNQIAATSNHCNREFNTFAELRDEHLAVCPLKPMRCPYYRLGCNFQATNKEMEKHTASCKHVTSFVDRFLDLEEKLLELRSENEGLRKMISESEDVIRKMQQTEQALVTRIQNLENQRSVFEEPLEQLLAEIAKIR